MKYQTLALSVIAVLLTVACGKKNHDDETVATFAVDDEAAMVAAATNSISSLAEDSDTSTPVSKSVSESPSSAFSTCGRVAAVQTCVNQARVATYDNCSLFSDATITGSVSLNYSSTNCRLSNAGDSVTRTFDVVFAGPYGGRLVVKSDTPDSQDFANPTQLISFGKGGMLTKTATGWQAEIGGRNIQILGRQGQELVNYSVRTTPANPVVINGTLSRSGRTVASGGIEIYHNRAKYVAKYSATNLQYSLSCCHPISGKLEALFAGSINGSGSIEFQGCGSAKLTKGSGEVKTLSLGNCE